MKPLGRTYLIEIPNLHDEIVENGIIIPAENKLKVGHFKGIIKEIGLGFNNDNEANIGDLVLFNWKEKQGKVKVIFNQELYYIIEEHLLLAIEDSAND